MRFYVCQQLCECGSIQGSTRVAAVVISRGEHSPALLLLTGDERHTSFPLGIERVKSLFETFFRGLPSVDGTPNELFRFLHGAPPCLAESVSGRRTKVQTI